MGTTIHWEAIDAELATALDGLDLEVDRERVERFAERIASGALTAAANRIPEREFALGGVDEVDALEEISDRRRGELAEIGRDALARGQVAVAVLNGGMATRFGGVVKGVVPVFGERSFLEVKRAQARARGPSPFLVMNSFATHEATQEFLAGRRDMTDGTHAFLQSVSLRLTPSGELFRDAQGKVSLYAPGHGDFPSALRRAGLVDTLRSSGVRTVLLSNVDNLGADPDPVVLGYHLASGRPLTCEVAPTDPGDVGGTPARVDGRLQIVEGFRLPLGLDSGSLRFLSTNSFALSLDLLESEHEFTWFYVEKEVDGRSAVQIERLVNELTAVADTNYLAVPRRGRTSRFFAVKTRDDLERLRADPELVARFSSV